MKHIIDLSLMSTQEFDEIYTITCDIMENPKKYQKALEGKILGSLFFEPSTRTNLSFTTAMQRLGGSVIGFSDPSASSTSKGESLKDTIKTVCQYADILVMRNPYEGSAYAASLYSDKPLINAGDGGHLHPTQTLNDLITIKKYLGRLQNFKIGICGDLKYGRTVHSLIKSLAKYPGIEFILIAPKPLQVPLYIVQFMGKNNLKYTFCENLEENLSSIDILYMTRIQRERFDDMAEYEKLKNIYRLDLEKLSVAKDNMLILHPLPRVDEIADEVDEDPRALYFKQAGCGMYGRMALMYYLLRDEKKPLDKTPVEIFTDKQCMNEKCITKMEQYLPKISNNYCAYCDKEMG